VLACLLSCPKTHSIYTNTEMLAYNAKAALESISEVWSGLTESRGISGFVAGFFLAFAQFVYFLKCYFKDEAAREALNASTGTSTEDFAVLALQYLGKVENELHRLRKELEQLKARGNCLGVYRYCSVNIGNSATRLQETQTTRKRQYPETTMTMKGPMTPTSTTSTKSSSTSVRFSQGNPRFLTAVEKKVNTEGFVSTTEKGER